MKFIVSGKNLEVSESIKERLKKKFKKYEKFLDEETEVVTTFQIEKNKHIVEVTIPFNGSVIRAKGKNDDVFTSIDRLMDVLDTQIRKAKTKASKKVKGTESIKNGGKPVEVEKEVKDKIVQYKKYPAKPMTVEEALMQIKSGKEKFLVFTNSDTQMVNMVHKLEKGGFGIVEPE